MRPWGVLTRSPRGRATAPASPPAGSGRRPPCPSGGTAPGCRSDRRSRWQLAGRGQTGSASLTPGQCLWETVHPENKTEEVMNPVQEMESSDCDSYFYQKSPNTCRQCYAVLFKWKPRETGSVNRLEEALIFSSSEPTPKSRPEALHLGAVELNERTN